MKKTKYFLALLLSLVFLILCACSGDVVPNEEEEQSQPQPQTKIELLKSYNGETVDILNSNLRAYLDLTDEQRICSFLKSRQGQTYVLGQSVSIKWNKTKTPYTVYIAEDSQISKVNYTKKCFIESVFIPDSVLMPGHTYYYKVTDGNGDSTAIDSFKVLDGVKWYAVGGVNNVRDLGGWKTVDGKYINTGKIIRSAKLDNVDENGQVVLGDLGIVSDLDLRTDVEATNAVSSPVNGLKYTRISISMYDRILASNARENIRKTLSFLSQESNYPVLMHCKAGADRTGTIAFLINGLCGVSYEDLTRDFEITSFSNAGTRWRSNIIQNNGISVFDESGVMSYDSGLYVAWNKMYKDICSAYPAGSGLLSDSIKAYMLDIGVLQIEIDNILRIMLG